MLKLATILDNPGEPTTGTRYRDPRHLRELGYNGLVIYETTGLSGVESPSVIGSGELRRWVTQQFEQVQQTAERAAEAGLAVYLCYDVLTLARDVVDRAVRSFTCRNRPAMLCPASDAALARSREALESLLARVPQAAGVVLRFGDNDAARLPHLVGNDIYQPHCASCSQLGRADRIITVFEQFHDLVVGRLGKRLIVRAWNVKPGGLHDTAELCRRIAPRLPGEAGDDRFVLSFKFTQADFWRYQQWNEASLSLDRRPILYELQCQREFEGKGGIPNWQAPLWRDGCDADEPGTRGLAHLTDKVNLAGVWAWVRGGGWGGPFVKNEAWIDANVYSVPRLADEPTMDLAALARQWVEQRLGVTDAAVAAVLERILEHSPQVIRRGFYIGPLARQRGNPWHPNADWIQDDMLDVDAAWRIIQRLPDDQLDEVVREKKLAAEQTSADRAALQQLINDANARTLDPLVNTLMYAESFFEALEHLIEGLVAYRGYLKRSEGALADACRQHLYAAQSQWNHHTQRHASLPGAATAFRESRLWDLTQTILAELEDTRLNEPHEAG